MQLHVIFMTLEQLNAVLFKSLSFSINDNIKPFCWKQNIITNVINVTVWVIMFLT
jgi:hypothetical protein